MLLAGGLKTKITAISSTMTVGSQSYVYIKPTYYDDGWIGAGTSEIFFGATAMGSMSAAGEAAALFWKCQAGGHTGNGQVWLEVSGNVSTTYVSQVLSNAVSLGTVTYSSYNSTTNTTLFTVGGNAVLNPFGTSGTKTIAIS
ncbi:hypothetical protein UFOVP4_21 [uncultured Caudovirales phage]|uniref:Uncharacterized protein n=1 Tax=uncultured Caudovirales phage TaxID=2100421 RepID=A0A6J7VKQ8_9CAUD|nr:hypothetical protein UFOVP4_21 [uncultured Caudovirales phage]CAB4241306.1 hypothetical protein UFOVP64_38 [uncultured Caudovirales phage]CAB5079011.1 hypothetical protein UFOVP145_52 [uncultured Caudovirales phage]